MNSLKSVIEIKNGKIAKRNGLKYPIFGGNGIIGYSNEYNYENIIIIGRVGANCGSVHKHSGKCWVSDNALAGLPINGCNDFNYYLIKSIDLNSKQIGSSQPLLTQNILYNLNINFPKELFTQQKIASVLSALDDKIELNNNINAELEQIAKTLYDYWFVQFDFPNEDGKPYKSSGGKMVYNKVLKREIPEGWEVKKIENLGSLKNGINYDPKLEGDSLAKIINVRNISQSSIFIENNDLDKLKLDQKDINKYLVDDNSIIIARSGTPGATRLIKNFESNTIYCGFIICLTVSDLRNLNLLYFNLKDFEKNITSQSNGTIMKNVNQQVLNNFDIIIPESKILNNFNTTINSIFDKILNNIKQNQELISLRDWLLPMLMNGQVKVVD